ncbi:sensor histidine kinase [Brevibacterium album]|uniref:sensor histidine kinase n=1 Tax=Brevibacterium album TaxID=417948 RepID=UPI0003F82930|nr:histidine kinase [Brevibacterium album]
MGSAGGEGRRFGGSGGDGGLGVWVRPRPGPEVYRHDALCAALLAVGAVTVALLYQRTGLFEEGAGPWAWVLGIGLSSLPLTFRRRFPVPTAIAVALGFFVSRQMGVPDFLMVDICLFLALYSVGAWERRRRLALWSRIGIIAAMFVWVATNLLVLSSGDELSEMFPDALPSSIFSAFATFAAAQLITNLLFFFGAFFFGERAWDSARTTARLEAQGRELERERRTSAEQAIALDRLEIARELHDVVAHHVSVMGIQAAAARRILERSPVQAVQSLAVVEDSAHAAVAELRSLVRTLRQETADPDAADASSTRGVAQLPELVEESRRSGASASLIVIGRPRPLPLLVDVALYRVVQEALTNVRKHAGPGAEAVVRLRFTSTGAEVEVADDGAGRLGEARSDPSGAGPHTAGGPAASRSGLGLRGMQERMGAVGGAVVARPRENGGFLVRATADFAGQSAGGSGGTEMLREAVEA